MKELIEFLYMGGDWAYVWSAYGITAIVMIINVILPIRQRKSLILQIKRKQDRGKKRK